jgi:hypothetical protein
LHLRIWIQRTLPVTSALVFGQKKYGQTDPESPSSRAGIFQAGSDDHKKARARGFLVLAAHIRNRTNHFTTRRRLARLVTSQNDQVPKAARPDFDKLLKFDISLQRQVLADDLNRIGVGRYLDAGQISQVCAEIAAAEDPDGVTLPKYFSLLKKVKALDENKDTELSVELSTLNGLDLDNYAKQQDGPNRCKVELLRQLYATGFKGWLATGGAAGASLQAAIDAVQASKLARAKAFQREHRQKYEYAETWLEDLSADERKDIASLSAALAARSMADGQAVRNYKPLKAEQSKRSNDIEALRQEIFAHLFAAYLKEKSLDWVFSLRELSGAEAATIKPEMITLPELAPKDWHSQFYAWLYLSPPDDISLLRHQFRKTAALEEKAAMPTDEALVANLADMDRLMALYTRVQSVRLRREGASGAHSPSGDTVRERSLSSQAM